jgi:hypothetical protein
MTKKTGTTATAAAPKEKKKTSFNVDLDLHRALRDYCYHEETDMKTYIFEKLVLADLKEKGYYPPKDRK